MKWRRGILVCGLIVVGVVLIGFVSNYRSEPRYKGKSLSAWLKIYCTADNHQRQNEAIDAIENIGTNAIPYLLDDLRHLEPSWKYRAAAWVSRWPGPFGKWWRRSLDGYVRNDRAIAGFTILRSNGVPAIPALLWQMGEAGRVRAAVRPFDQLQEGNLRYFEEGPPMVLAAIGGPAVVPMMTVATNRSESTDLRWRVLIALGNMGPNANQCVGALISCLDDEEGVSESAIYALGRVATEPKPIIPVLTNTLTSPSALVRAATIRSLAVLSMRPLGVSVLTVSPFMRVGLNDPDRRVREVATNELRIFFPEEFRAR